ncbi:unnamed protein product [Rotaria magnacalcarata]|uniref:Uncharacterized protein n=1 Tax=Rotaria magnacalcarata TaxID=392030 RepID=A0A816F8X6_9BILA|nr:unnamed protein product [Rotaria magnacalcarata]CAF1659364.1 unnamed protein product [Rotaria magnacalcarata]CAF3824027.1 unnamed protein product [Rotaria magnacalcarata]CAF3843825.1 unnamed protein product [Rotaria magnacalcarata]CAF3852589.1 unnamed protein product [Rotaria magnacalcarata]
MRNKILNLPTARQSQVLISAATADIGNDQTDEPKTEQTTTAPKATVLERNKKEHTRANKLIVHYTHEKRFQTFKSDMHQVYDNIFKDTPAADFKLIVCNKNRRSAKTELICKRPKQSLLIKKPFKSKASKNDTEKDNNQGKKAYLIPRTNNQQHPKHNTPVLKPAQNINN